MDISCSSPGTTGSVLEKIQAFGEKNFDYTFFMDLLAARNANRELFGGDGLIDAKISRARPRKPDEVQKIYQFLTLKSTLGIRTTMYLLLRQLRAQMIWKRLKL